MPRVLAVIYAVPGVGFVVSTLAVLLYLRERGELPMTPFGWRLLGGPYPEIGTDRLTPLGWALAGLLIAVSGVDVLIGRWLWQGRRRGAILAVVMAPVSFALGWLGWTRYSPEGRLSRLALFAVCSGRSASSSPGRFG
ncbi:MAG: hypothetical protein ABI595_15790 [Actinomycetota bacterium]